MADVTNVPAAEFRLHDHVRLLARHGEFPSGALGRILGWFARDTDPTYYISFDGEDVCAVDVRFDEIVLADDLRASAA